MLTENALSVAEKNFFTLILNGNVSKCNQMTLIHRSLAVHKKKMLDRLNDGKIQTKINNHNYDFESIEL